LKREQVYKIKISPFSGPNVVPDFWWLCIKLCVVVWFTFSNACKPSLHQVFRNNVSESLFVNYYLPVSMQVQAKCSHHNLYCRLRGICLFLQPNPCSKITHGNFVRFEWIHMHIKTSHEQRLLWNCSMQVKLSSNGLIRFANCSALCNSWSIEMCNWIWGLKWIDERWGTTLLTWWVNLAVMWIACASCGSIAKGLMLNTY
jgi:hypothetical protein